MKQNKVQVLIKTQKLGYNNGYVFPSSDSTHYPDFTLGDGSLNAIKWLTTAPYGLSQRIEGWVKCRGQISLMGLVWDFSKGLMK